MGSGTELLQHEHNVGHGSTAETMPAHFLSQNGNSDSSSAKPVLTRPIMAGLVSAMIGASFQYGYNVGNMNAPACEIVSFFYPLPSTLEMCNETALEEGNITLQEYCKENLAEHKYYQTGMYSIPVCMFAAGGMVGTLLVKRFSKFFGRLGSLMICNILSFLAALLFGFSKGSSSIAIFVLARITIGIFAGLINAFVPIYVEGIIHEKWRLKMVFLNQVFIAFGVLTAQILSKSDVLGSKMLWPLMFACTCLPSAFSLSLYIILPATPDGFLSERKSKSEVRTSREVETEIERVQVQAAQNDFGKMSILVFLKDRKLRRRIFAMSILMAAHQLCGVNALFYYTYIIFEDVGMTDQSSQEFSLICIGAVYVSTALLAERLSKRFSRRNLLFGGFVFMALWYVAMTVISNIKLQNPADNLLLTYGVVACVVGCVIGYAIGPGPICWMMIPDIFPAFARPAAFLCCCMLDWLFHFVVARTFFDMHYMTGTFVYIGFAIVCCMVALYILWYFPKKLSKKSALLHGKPPHKAAGFYLEALRRDDDETTPGNQDLANLISPVDDNPFAKYTTTPPGVVTFDGSGTDRFEPGEEVTDQKSEPREPFGPVEFLSDSFDDPTTSQIEQTSV